MVKIKFRGKVNGTLLDRKEKEQYIILYILYGRKLNIIEIKKLL